MRKDCHKLEHLEIVKGISILMIMAFHICGQIFHAEPRWVRILSFQGVNTFLAVSGFGLAYSALHRGIGSVSWGGWLRRRIWRTVPLYWAVLLVSFTVYVLKFRFLKVAPYTNDILKDFFLHATFLHVYFKDFYYSLNPALWYMGVIVQMYVIFPFIFWLFIKAQRYAWIILAVIFVSVVLLSRIESLPPLLVKKSLDSLVFFAAGICLAVSRREDRSYPGVFTTYFLICSLALSVFLLRHLATGPTLPGAWLIFSLCIFALIYTSAHTVVGLSAKHGYLRAPTAAISLIGSSSYAIYLVHWGLIVPIVYAFAKLPSGRLIGIAVYGILVILIGYTLTKADRTARGRLQSVLFPDAGRLQTGTGR